MVQATLNQRAIDMLPRCAFFLKTFGGNDTRLVRAICNTSPCLAEKNAFELNEFDVNQLSALLKERMSDEKCWEINRLEEEAHYLQHKQSA